jgi:hypothetical protein
MSTAKRRLRPIFLGTLIVLASAGCAGTPAAAPTSSPPAATASAPSTALAPSPALAAPSVVTASSAPSSAAPSVAAPSFAIPSFAIPSFAIPSVNLGSFQVPGLHADPALEARLPNQVCGTDAFKLSFTAATGSNGALGGLGGGLSGLFGGLGSVGAYSIAVATVSPTAAPSASCDTTFFALQLQGGDASQFVTLIGQAATRSGGSVSQASLGGKNVTVIDDSSGSKTYVYALGDTAFGVSAPDDATAGQALAQLP